MTWKPDCSLRMLDEERAVPWGDAGLFEWHIARYRFALPFVEGRRTLDLGSGEGYGAALLAEHAREVVGLDYSPEAVRHARQTYLAPNLHFDVANAMALDLESESFDVVTCFEVVEHLEDDAPLFAGVAAALSTGGVLILSTPNMLVENLFNRVRGEQNEYHINALAPGELRVRAKRHFRHVAVYGQSIRGNRLHTVLKAVDVLNLRHRLIRSAGVQRALTPPLVGGEIALLRPTSFRFNRLLARQSPQLVLVARK